MTSIRTPYLGAYVREHEVCVSVISIIHHKLCKGAIDAQKSSTGTNQSTHGIVLSAVIIITVKQSLGNHCQPMSSYFVNSFCSRYPNSADYPLHNYGDHSTGDQYRNSTAMHSSRYGYGYSGMDLSTGRSTPRHFVSSGERVQSYTQSPTATPVDARYSQPITASNAAPQSPPPEQLACSSVNSSPISEPAHRALKNSIPNSTGPTSNGAGPVLGCEDDSKMCNSMEEEKPTGSAQTTSQSVSETTQPQIYPWMRKLHLSHGKKNE